MPAARSWAKGMLSERNLRIAAQTAAIAGDLATTSASVALPWAACQPGVTAVIIGPDHCANPGCQRLRVWPGRAVDMLLGSGAYDAGTFHAVMA